MDLHEDGGPLAALQVVAVRASIPSDRSFQSFDSALAHILAPPLAATFGLVWQQALMDVLLETPVQSEDSDFAITSRYGLKERVGIILISMLVGHTAWHWVVERMPD